MAQVIWASSALDDIAGIAEYIARDSPDTALRGRRRCRGSVLWRLFLSVRLSGLKLLRSALLFYPLGGQSNCFEPSRLLHRLKIVANRVDVVVESAGVFFTIPVEFLHDRVSHDLISRSSSGEHTSGQQ